MKTITSAAGNCMKNIRKSKSTYIKVREIKGTVDKVICKHKNYPNILVINSEVVSVSLFAFEEVSLCYIEKNNRNINPKRASRYQTNRQKLQKQVGKTIQKKINAQP